MYFKQQNLNKIIVSCKLNLFHDLQIPEKSFSSSFVKTGNTNAQDSILRTPKHSEKVEYPTSVTRSSSKLKNDGTSFSSSNVLPEKDTSLQTSEDQPVSNDSVMEGSNANEDHFNSTKTKTVLDADQNMVSFRTLILVLSLHCWQNLSIRNVRPCYIFGISIVSARINI